MWYSSALLRPQIGHLLIGHFWASLMYLQEPFAMLFCTHECEECSNFHTSTHSLALDIYEPSFHGFSCVFHQYFMRPQTEHVPKLVALSRTHMLMPCFSQTMTPIGVYIFIHPSTIGLRTSIYHFLMILTMILVHFVPTANWTFSNFKT